MAKPVKIRDPKLRKLLDEVRKSRAKKAPKKTSRTFHVKRAKAPKRRKPTPAAGSTLARAQALLDELRAMGLNRPARAAAPRPKRRKAAKKRVKRATHKAWPPPSGLRIPSLPADHPFNRPRKAAKKRAKKRAKKTVKRTARTFHVKRSTKRPARAAAPRRKATKKRAKKSKRTAKRAR
jgi:hypothetical protein